MSRLIACVTILLSIIGSTAGQYSSTCVEVSNHFFPCVTYLIESESSPADGCCDGLRELNSMAKNNNDPGDICQCIEDMDYVMDVPYVASRIQSLPQECHTHLSFPISVHMNCFQ